MNHRMVVVLGLVVLASTSLSAASLASASTIRRRAGHDRSYARQTLRLPPPLQGWGASISQAERNKALTEKIAANEKMLAQRGIDLTEWGPDAISGKVKIHLTHYSAWATKLLYSMFGRNILVARSSMPRPTRFGRGDDIAPFDGGDYTYLHNFGYCSGGPIVEDVGGYRYMLLAGHCDPNISANVRRSDASGNTGGPLMGVVSSIRFCNNCMDVELIDHSCTGCSYNATVWGGSGGTGNPSYAEDQATYPQQGQYVTNDSVVTGEVGKIDILAVEQNVTFADGITTVHLTSVFKSGDAITNPGDSGGPWIVHENNSSLVNIAGTTVGGSTCDSHGNNCKNGWYEQINNINSFFNTHVP